MNNDRPEPIVAPAPPAMGSPVEVIDLAGFERLRRVQRVDPRAVRTFRTALLKHGASDEASLGALPQKLARHIRLHPLQLERRADSQRDGASKLLFRTRDGVLIETVILRIATGRTTLCISSQAGCAAGCDFCATGKMGLARNLSPAEIVDQLVQAQQLLALENRRVRNLVFMGMGEPFHNEANVYAALSALFAPELVHHAPGRVLLSTVGIPEAMIRCVRRFPGVNLALSLHSVAPAIRERLIPLARKISLEALRQAIATVAEIQTRQGGRRAPTVMIEYLMLAGLNDSDGDADALIAWLQGLAVHVNLIPFNAIDGATHLTASSAAVRERFAARLKGAGLPTTIRYSLGADVAAACGQLVQRARAPATAPRRAAAP